MVVDTLPTNVKTVVDTVLHRIRVCLDQKKEDQHVLRLISLPSFLCLIRAKGFRVAAIPKGNCSCNLQGEVEVLFT